MSLLLVILILTMQKTDILRQSFEGVFVGLGPCELAQVTIGLIRNRSKSCEEVGSGVDWLADKWPALPEQLLTLGTSPWPNSCPQDKDNDNDKRTKNGQPGKSLFYGLRLWPLKVWKAQARS